MFGVKEHFGNLENKGTGFRKKLFSSSILIIISINTIAMSILKSSRTAAAKSYSAQHQEPC